MLQPTATICRSCGGEAPQSLQVSEQFLDTPELQLGKVQPDRNQLAWWQPVVAIGFGSAALVAAYALLPAIVVDALGSLVAYPAMLLAVLVGWLPVRLMYRRPPSRMGAVRELPGVTTPALDRPVTEGRVFRLERRIASHLTGTPCLASSLAARRPNGRYVVRATREVDFMVEDADKRVLVTGPVWLSGPQHSSQAATRGRMRKLGIPDNLDLAATLSETILCDGARVRIHSDISEEWQPARAGGYRDGSCPVIRGEPGRPVVVEVLPA